MNGTERLGLRTKKRRTDKQVQKYDKGQLCFRWLPELDKIKNKMAGRQISKKWTLDLAIKEGNTTGRKAIAQRNSSL